MADRPRSLAALALSLAVAGSLVGCGSGDDARSGGGVDLPATTTEAGTDGGGAGEPTGAAACAALSTTLLLPVGAPTPDDEAGAAAVADAMAVVAEEGPGEVAADAARWTELVDVTTQGVPPGTADGELNALVVEGYEAVERVHAWALASCPVEDVVWACPETSLRPLLAIDGAGEDDDEDGVAASEGEPGAASAQEVIDVEAEVDDPPVEIRRSADEVVVAWLDEGGRAHQAMTVVDDDGWRLASSEWCQAIDGGVGVGGP